MKKKLENELIVVLKKQDVDPRKFAKLIGDNFRIANYSEWIWDRKGNRLERPTKIPDYDTWPDPETYPIQRVTGMKKGEKWTGIFGSGTLDWHCNLNGPSRADGVALQALEGCEGTVTSWLDTSKALKDMPETFVKEISKEYAQYEYSPEVWAKGLPEEQLEIMSKNKHKYKMWVIQENIAGIKGIYFYALNRCSMFRTDLQEELEYRLFQEKYMYHHEWETGDIVLSDQLLTLHKRQQDDPKILAKRILNRITFYISGSLIKRNNAALNSS
tara:strand:- start:90 stop:905 length:816 start_codon:yes stop_codon:yes gene_type:complete